MKSGRRLLSQEVAVPPSFNCFLSFPIHKTGYSGVATYTRSSVVVPVKAEEGITGALQPKPPLKSEEKISSYEAYPPSMASGPVQEGEEPEEVDFAHLDSEGRAIVTDMGLFVLINTYCPNDSGTPEREKFKMQYHRLLEGRVRRLIEEGRQVIVVGDINACAGVIDHCEGDLMIKKGLTMGLEGEEGFWGAEYRRWLRDWLQENGGPLVDVTRRFWPERKGMFTCTLSLANISVPLSEHSQVGIPRFQHGNRTMGHELTTFSPPRLSCPGSKPPTPSRRSKEVTTALCMLNFTNPSWILQLGKLFS
jgi:AP endonuclease 2